MISVRIVSLSCLVLDAGVSHMKNETKTAVTGDCKKKQTKQTNKLTAIILERDQQKANKEAHEISTILQSNKIHEGCL